MTAGVEPYDVVVVGGQAGLACPGSTPAARPSSVSSPTTPHIAAAVARHSGPVPTVEGVR